MTSDSGEEVMVDKSFVLAAMVDKSLALEENILNLPFVASLELRIWFGFDSKFGAYFTT